jgi:hypothetical protein
VLERFDHRSPGEFEPNTAVTFLRDAILASPGDVTLLTIGPLTNVGLLSGSRTTPEGRLARRFVGRRIELRQDGGLSMVDQMTTDRKPTTTSQAQEAASKATDEATTQASELKDAAKEHAGAVVSEAKQQARSVLRNAQSELQKQAEQQAHRAGDGMRQASTQLQKMADAGEAGVVTDLTRQLAGTLEHVSTRIGDGGLRAVGDDLRDFARRQPGLFLLGAGVAGFFVTRAVRAAGAAANAPEDQGSPPSGNGISSPSPAVTSPSAVATGPLVGAPAGASGPAGGTPATTLP